MIEAELVRNHWHLLDNHQRTLFVFRTPGALAEFVRTQRWSPDKLTARRCTLTEDACQAAHPIYTPTAGEFEELIIQRPTFLESLGEWENRVEASDGLEVTVA